MADFDMLCQTSLPLSSYQEPDDFVVEYAATIRHEGEAVGQAVLYKVLLGLACNYGQDSAEIFDAHSEKLLKVYEALFDPDTDDFWEDIERQFQPCGNDLLIIDAITLDKKWRGLKLGLLAMRKLIDLLDGDCGLVVCHPQPLENAETPEQVRQGKVKLRRYIRRLGFRRIGKTGFYGLSTTLINPKFEEVLRPSAEKERRETRRP